VLSVDGWNLDTLGLRQGSGVPFHTCGAAATHCVYLAYVDYDAERAGSVPPVVAAGACYYPSDSEMSISSSSQQMLRSKGVVCSGTAGHAVDGSFAYACCTSDNCNAPSAGALTTVSEPDCHAPEAKACADKYALAYGCLARHIPLSPDDPCAEYVWGSGYNCLAQACNCSCPQQAVVGSGFGSGSGSGRGNGNVSDGVIGEGSASSSGAPRPDDGGSEIVGWTVCQRIQCPQRAGACAPGCDYTKVGDGRCDGLCMNSMCHFDGGDCLLSTGWYTHLDQQMAALDTDRNQRISEAEFTHPTAQPWTSGYDEGQAPSFLYDQSSFSWCGAEGEGLGRQLLALGSFAPYFPSAQADAETAIPDARFGLLPHPHLDPLRTSLYLISSADADVDGALSFDEAQQSYQLNWHEFTFMNALADHQGSAVEAEEMASVLERVVRTLRGEPWPDRDAFYGADVAASVTVKLLSRCRGKGIDEVAAQALGIPAEGLRWADVDGSGTLDVDELLAVLKHVTGSAGVVPLSEGEVEVQLGMPGMRPDEMRWLLLPDWHYALPLPQQLLPGYHHQLPSTVPPEEANQCTHSDARLEEIRRFVFHRNRLTPRGAAVARSSTSVRSGAHAEMRRRAAVAQTAAAASSVEQKQGDAADMHSPRLAAMRQVVHGAVRRILDDSQGSGLGEGGGGGERPAQALEFPFVVSLERPSCSFLDMVADALSEGAYKLYMQDADAAEAQAARTAALRRAGLSTTGRGRSTAGGGRGLLQMAGTDMPGGNSFNGSGSGAGQGFSAPLTCPLQPLEFMVTTFVMAALDSNGDGVLSWDETCLSEQDFVIAADQYGGASSLTYSELDALVIAELFVESDTNQDGILDVAGQPDPASQSWIGGDSLAGPSYVDAADHLLFVLSLCACMCARKAWAGAAAVAFVNCIGCGGMHLAVAAVLLRHLVHAQPSCRAEASDNKVAGRRVGALGFHRALALPGVRCLGSVRHCGWCHAPRVHNAHARFARHLWHESGNMATGLAQRGGRHAGTAPGALLLTPGGWVWGQHKCACSPDHGAGKAWRVLPSWRPPVRGVRVRVRFGLRVRLIRWRAKACPGRVQRIWPPPPPLGSWCPPVGATAGRRAHARCEDGQHVRKPHNLDPVLCWHVDPP